MEQNARCHDNRFSFLADKNMDERYEKRQWGKAIAQMNGCGSLCLFCCFYQKFFVQMIMNCVKILYRGDS
jgi:hypothetical protein